MSLKVLFLCTGNSCRSQMAEALAKARAISGVDFYSAGTEKHGLNPFMLQVLKELPLPTEQLFSKTFDELQINFDLIITICADADEKCPAVGTTTIIHRPFDDPPVLARGAANDEEILTIYRSTRDQIKNFVDTKLEGILGL